MAFFPNTFLPWMQCLLPSEFTPSPQFDDGVVDHPHVELVNQELWDEFSGIGTEMVITKHGRRVFPVIRVKLSGLDPNAKYYLLMDLVSTSPCRYKFLGGKWIASGTADPEIPLRPFFHPDSPATGAHWMAKGANFNKVKLTNNMSDEQGNMLLHSMHKYLPRLHLIRCDAFSLPIYPTLKTFSWDKTAFIAVTAYQNTEVTELKIAKNPFAKGFRKDGAGKREKKRLMQKQEEMEEDEEDGSEREQKRQRNQEYSDVTSDFVAQWQFALFSALAPSLCCKGIQNATKKGGFDIMDLLARP